LIAEICVGGGALVLRRAAGDTSTFPAGGRAAHLILQARKLLLPGSDAAVAPDAASAVQHALRRARLRWYRAAHFYRPAGSGRALICCSTARPGASARPAIARPRARATCR
jgi:hypothetical protein